MERRRRSRQTPTSHRQIEKRRRDRMNSGLAELRHLLQPGGQRRLDNTAVIQLASKRIRQLQAPAATDTAPHPDVTVADGTYCDLRPRRSPFEEGYRECELETLQWLVEREGLGPNGPLCIGVMKHLHQHLAFILRGADGPQSLVSSSGDWQRDNASREHSGPPPPPPARRHDRATRSPVESDSSSPEPTQFSCLGYKFKARLKRRFTATSAAGGWHHRTLPAAGSLYAGPDVQQPHQTQAKLPRRWDVTQVPEGADERGRETPADTRRLVPVLALHARGSSYLPMMVEVSSLGGQAERLTDHLMPIPHAVSISVCFFTSARHHGW